MVTLAYMPKPHKQYAAPLEATSEGQRSVLFAKVAAELHKAARIRAVQEGKTIGQLVQSAVENYLAGAA